MSGPIRHNFEGVASSGDTKQEQAKKRPSPFPVRLSAEERAYLEAKAGRKPLGTYIRGQLLGDAQNLRKKTTPSPRLDDALLAKLLGKLGQSDQVRCLFLLLVAAESGRVSLGEDERAALLGACASVQEMRSDLITALGLKKGGKQ